MLNANANDAASPPEGPAEHEISPVAKRSEHATRYATPRAGTSVNESVTLN